MQKFLSELQRRKVLRVATGYVIAGWVILQVALSLQAAMNLPAWFASAIMAVLLIGFPIAVFASWFFEFTPEGIRRTAPSTEIVPLKFQATDLALAAALVLVLAAVAVKVMSPVQQQAANPAAPRTPLRTATAEADAPDPESSIAVLPFADLSPKGDQVYFSDGIAEEILNALAHAEGLKVASRTSAFQYRNNTIGIPAIAKALGVRHILEGSVRRAGNTVRITAQLIDAPTDAHLWSQTFDRPISTATIFAIQDEIAKAIVAQLSATITAKRKIRRAATKVPDTANFDAYELYLRGWSLFLRRGKENLTAAASALERATEIDPKFARAWAALSAVYTVSSPWGIKDRDFDSLARAAAANALRLDPELSLPFTVRGNTISNAISTDLRSTWEDVLASYDQAIDRDSRNATAWLWRGITFMNLGYFDQAEKDFDKCADADPGYENCRRWKAHLRLDQGRDEEAFRLFELGLKANGLFNRNPPFAAAYAAHGNRPMALALLAQPFSDAPMLIDPIFRSLTDSTFSEADKQQALALLKAVPGGATHAAEAHLMLRDYDNIPKEDIDAVVWWTRIDPVFVKSQARKNLMRAWRLPDYWRKHGFPPQCKPVGADDFACD